MNQFHILIEKYSVAAIKEWIEDPRNKQNLELNINSQVTSTSIENTYGEIEGT